MAQFKFNPFTGNFDLVGSSSGVQTYQPTPDVIDPGVEITVPAGTQMLLHHFLDNQGLLTVEGLVTVIESDADFGYPEVIRPGEVYAVPVRRQVVIDDLMENQGLLEVFGTLRIQ